MDHILLIEDEENLREGIRLNLEMEGYAVTDLGDAIGLEELLNKESFDLALLDVMLPGMDGFAICKLIRSRKPDLPVIFITARNASEDRIRGLKTGADDYLAKPFHLEELILRIRNLLKRTSTTEVRNEFHFDGNRIDFGKYECVPSGGEPVQISNRESELLRLLVNKKGQVVSRDEILERFWPDGDYPSPRVIDNYILNFRRIFEPKRLGKKYFQSVRGVGYKFSP